MGFFRKRYTLQVSFSPFSLLVGIMLGVMVAAVLQAHSMPEREPDSQQAPELTARSLKIVDSQGNPVIFMGAFGDNHNSEPLILCAGQHHNTFVPEAMFIGQLDSIPVLRSGEETPGPIPKFSMPLFMLFHYNPQQRKMDGLFSTGFTKVAIKKSSSAISPYLYSVDSQGNAQSVQIFKNRLKLAPSKGGKELLNMLNTIMQMMHKSSDPPGSR